MKKKINLENILLIFIIFLPILDMSSFIFRNNFNINFSPSTFIRPIIPIIAIIIIFFKNKFKLKTFFICVIYGIYAITHIIIYYFIKTGSSYGTILHEIQYLVNYSFMILNLFIYSFIFKLENSLKLKKSIFIASGIYIVSIFISILTDTSSTTYLEGMGKKGWFESGNSITSILLLCTVILLTMINDKNLKWKFSIRVINISILSVILLVGIFLSIFVGTRTGLFGFIGIVGTYIFFQIVFALFYKNKLNKRLLTISISVMIVLVVIVGVFGSSTLIRRRHLQNSANDIIDSSTGKASHVTGDILRFKEQIELGEISQEYMPETVQRSILRLYEYANENELLLTDNRMQQIVYNIYLMQEQKNIGLILFGNGFLANYSELVLEMEIPAFLINFGLVGFGLYFVPFLCIAFYSIYVGIKNWKKLDVEYLMLVFGCFISFGLSLLAGYTFFNSSSMMIIIVINVLLIYKMNILKKETK